MDELFDPAALRTASPEDLAELTDELRAFLVRKVSRAGGHLGPNLGVVELTLALHHTFDTPRDRLIWDTGHQAYVHKILTGRAADFDGLRRRGGLSGYPSPAESVYDIVENSHASTALSYADGLARADARLGREDRRVVAVVGDGSLTGGMAWEALNNIGASGRSVVVVLNDNGRSYAPTAGALGAHLAALRDGSAVPVFEGWGLDYLGPVDGHDLPALCAALAAAKERSGPVLVHVVTQKGHGFVHTEQNELDRGHAIKPMDPETGRPLSSGGGPSFTSVFSECLVETAEEREDVVAVTAAMAEPTGLLALARRHPDRVADVGIAEQHALTMAAGLALGGLHPVVAIYSTFLTRAVDQVLLDVALHRCAVTLVLDRAGITGDDGPSHNGMWDLSLLSMVPGLHVAAPRDGTRLRELFAEAVAWDEGPTVLRFPKGSTGADVPAVMEFSGLDVLVREGPLDVLFVAVGVMGGLVVEASAAVRAEGAGVTVVDPRWVSPVPGALVDVARRHRLVVTVEDGVVVGGVGWAVAAALHAAGVSTPVRTAGIRARFLDHGSRSEVLAECGLTTRDVARLAIEELSALDAERPLLVTDEEER